MAVDESEETPGVLRPASQRQPGAAEAQRRAQQGSQQVRQQQRKAGHGTPTRGIRRAGLQQQEQEQPEQPEQQQQQQQQVPASGKAPGPGAADGGAGSGGGCGLGANTSVLAARAEWLQHQGRHEECYALTERVLERDPYATECLAPHLAAALELGRKNELFLRWGFESRWCCADVCHNSVPVEPAPVGHGHQRQRACMHPAASHRRSHQLVEEYPDSALSWFAVGCYYMAARQFEAARRYFSKATSLDRNSAHAWVGFGHAFAMQVGGNGSVVSGLSALPAAVLRNGGPSLICGSGACLGLSRMDHAAPMPQWLQSLLPVTSRHKPVGYRPLTMGRNRTAIARRPQDESDQALAAYRTAARLFPGLHTPVLGMGMEYSRMNNLGLAERLFDAAHRLCPGDPRVLHELGALEYRNGRYAAAERWLASALAAAAPGGGPPPAAAEPTLLALGHARRKLREYGGALAAYRAALALAPNSASTHAAVAFALQLGGDCAGAVREYHVALGLRPDDTFAQEMLGEALREECARASAELDDV